MPRCTYFYTYHDYSVMCQLNILYEPPYQKIKDSRTLNDFAIMDT